MKLHIKVRQVPTGRHEVTAGGHRSVPCFLIENGDVFATIKHMRTWGHHTNVKVINEACTFK